MPTLPFRHCPHTYFALIRFIVTGLRGSGLLLCLFLLKGAAAGERKKDHFPAHYVAPSINSTSHVGACTEHYYAKERKGGHNSGGEAAVKWRLRTLYGWDRGAARKKKKTPDVWKDRIYGGMFGASRRERNDISQLST
jgi:hypothetical protein